MSRIQAGVTSVRRGGGSRTFRTEAEKADASDRAVATQAVTMTSLLAAQEAESDAQRDREARRHGEAMLGELDGLQRALLGEGGVDLGELGRLAGQSVPVCDPRLAAVVRAIQLRAGLELARRGA